MRHAARGVSGGDSSRRRRQVRVLEDKQSRPRYRFSLDDTICFLREQHDKYGTCFVVNLLYQSEGGFNVPQFPPIVQSGDDS